MRRWLHWMLALAVAVAWFTGDEGPGIAAHAVAGGAVAVVAGPSVARLVRGRRWPGPTRIAGVSTLVGLGLVVALVATGAIVLGGEEGEGPLRGLVGVGAGIAVHRAHALAATALLAWIGVHVVGASLHWLRHPPPVRVEAIGALGAAAAGIAVAVGFLRWPAAEPATAVDPTLQAACGECHLTYPPSLLPARSWERMLVDPDHFDEQLGLDPATLASVGALLAAGAADHAGTEHAWRIALEVPADAAPQRITELDWWSEAHADVPDDLFLHPDVRGRARCQACHADAESGAFQAPPDLPATPKENR